MSKTEMNRDDEAQVRTRAWGESDTEMSAFAACWGLVKLAWEFVNYLIVRFLYLVLRALWVMFRPKKPITAEPTPQSEPSRKSCEFGRERP
ncbi:MAG: hypothetical protein OXD00_03555 [Gammaproteobacteria bacterium]|nr:hypothetical protein [Gammaproteobacteria bacterium]